MTTVTRIAQLLDRPKVRNRIIVALWVAVAAAVVTRLSVTLSNPIMPGEMFRGSERYFLDFRDTIWTPGRFLLDGGNPYDPDTYLAAHPWALPFSLYTPAWLLLAVVIAPLPYLISVGVFQLLSLGVAVVMLRTIFKWAMPTLVAVAVPAALLWMNIWYPGRGALSVQLGSLLGVLGVTLVLRSLTTPEVPNGTQANGGPGRHRRAVDAAGAAGVALALVKAQFGVVVLVALLGGRFREVWRGIAALALLSMPVLIACTVAAGGPVEFVQSVLRDLAVLNSDAGPTGLSNPVQRRLDLLGQLARYGLTDPPLWLEVAVPLLAFVACVVVVRLTRNPLLVSVVVCTSILVGFYHGTYDLLLLLVPVAVGVGMAIRGELNGVVERIMVGALLLVVLHLHTVSTNVIPGLDVRAADTVNLVLIMTGLTCGVYCALSAWLRTTRRSSLVTV